ncbi:MAG: hypothetical protein IPJ84_08175 [Bdellovibrionales bacterium]|nr:hypothetical protein [Bdellovibrionales bacterium]
MTLRERFLKGQYSELARAFDQGRLSLNPKSQNWIAASLALTGRVDDALALTTTESSLPRFYIAVSMTRSSRFREARALLIENALQTQDRSRFFAYQGFGFYAFFEGRFQKALFWANKAWLIALKSKSLHERVLSADLRGHALLQMGEIEKGLESLETALDTANRIDNKTHLTALRASIAIASATADSNHLEQNEVLERLLKESTHYDSYTGANILIELARQHNLRGRYREALKIIGSTRPLIRAIRHRRQEASLAVREAYSHFRLGDTDRAIAIIERAQKKLEPQGLNLPPIDP